ncbi:MAG TPA: glycosyltransferase family 4 protein [Bacteroidales bacterium]
MKLALTVKTKLQFDGRVLSQVYTLAKAHPDWQIVIFLISDGGGKVELPENVEVREMKLWTRNLPKSSFFQAIKMFESALILNIKLLKFKPDVLHVHDEPAILGPIFYKKINKKVKLVYDDHELRNLDKHLVGKDKLMANLENRMFKIADTIIMANDYRRDYAIKHSSLISKQKDKIEIISNFPFSKKETNKSKRPAILQDNSIKYLLHQSVAISEDRGKQILIETLKRLPDDWKLVIIGVNEEAFNNFMKGNEHLKEKVIFGGFIPYNELEEIWKIVDAAVIFYETTKINNRLCAPNRLYLAANHGIPLIVNDNPVLKDFVENTKSGVVVKNDYSEIDRFFSSFNEIQFSSNKLKGEFTYDSQAEKLVKIYDQLI